VLRGDLNGALDVNGDARSISVFNGSIGSASPVTIHGNLTRMSVLDRSAGAAIESDIQVDGRLNSFRVSGGDFTADLTAGDIGRATYRTQNGLTNNLTSNTDLGALVVVPSGGQAMSSSASLDVNNSMRRALFRGNVRGDISIGSGQSEDGAGSILITGDFDATGGPNPDMNIDGDLRRIQVNGNFEADTSPDADLSARNLGTLSVRGNLSNAFVDVENETRNVRVTGDYTNSRIQSDRLGRVVLRGNVQGQPEDPDDRVSSVGDEFSLIVEGRWRRIRPGEPPFTTNDVTFEAV